MGTVAESSIAGDRTCQVVEPHNVGDYRPEVSRYDWIINICVQVCVRRFAKADPKGVVGLSGGSVECDIGLGAATGVYCKALAGEPAFYSLNVVIGGAKAPLEF